MWATACFLPRFSDLGHLCKFPYGMFYSTDSYLCTCARTGNRKGLFWMIKVIMQFLLVCTITYGWNRISSDMRPKGPLGLKVLQEGFLSHFDVCVALSLIDPRENILHQPWSSQYLLSNDHSIGYMLTAEFKGKHVTVLPSGICLKTWHIK